MLRPSSGNSIYKVNEIFYSLQGEGRHAGMAAVFVRLAGCNMGCKWCDSKYAQKINFLLTPADILKEIKKYPAKTIIITGGEPTQQPLKALLKALKKAGYKIHLETNGSVDIDTSLIGCVTVSPKKRVKQNMLKKADAIKLILDGATKKTQILKYKKYINKKTSLYLQPEGNKKENINLCLQIIKENPQINLSLQLHKLIKIK